MHLESDLRSVERTAATTTATSRARDRMIADHLNIAHHCAARIHRSAAGAGVPYEDLVAYGCQGLVEAVQNYDPTRGASFLAFCFPRVRGAILDGIRAFHRISYKIYAQLDAPDAHVSFAEGLDVPAEGHRWNGKPFVSPPAPEEHEVSDHVRAGLDALPHLERRLIELCYFEGKSLQDAGTELGMQRSWACRLHARAISTLAASLLQ